MNKVFINNKDRIGEIVLIGDQTRETANMAIEASIKLDADQQQKFDRVATLVDISQIGKISAESQQATIRGLAGVNFDKLAVLGATAPQEIVLKSVVELSGKSNKVKFFRDRGAAIKWLNEMTLV